MPTLRRLLLYATVGQPRDMRRVLQPIHTVSWRRLPNAAERRISDRRHERYDFTQDAIGGSLHPVVSDLNL